MRPTSEELFRIPKQPSNFCDSIDPLLNKITTINDKIEETLNDVSNNLCVGDSLLLLDSISLPSDPLDDFSTLIDEMEKWSKGWLNHFEKSIKLKSLSEEHNEHLQCEFSIYSEHIQEFVNSTNDIYQKMERAFNEIEVGENYYNTYVSSYNEISNNDDFVTEDNESSIEKLLQGIDTESGDFNTATWKFTDAIEELRGEALNLREIVNNHLKVETKKQLVVADDEEWCAFMNCWLEESDIRYYNTIIIDMKNKLSLTI